jgi:hypothetical protein
MEPTPSALGGRHDRVRIRIAVGVVVPELADRDRQPGVDEGVEVGADLVGVSNTPYMWIENMVLAAGSLANTSAPLSRMVNDQSWPQFGASATGCDRTRRQATDGGGGDRGPVGDRGRVVAVRLVADVDQDVVLLAGQDIGEAHPVVDRLVEGPAAPSSPNPVVWWTSSMQISVDSPVTLDERDMGIRTGSVALTRTAGQALGPPLTRIGRRAYVIETFRRTASTSSRSGTAR